MAKWTETARQLSFQGVIYYAMEMTPAYMCETAFFIETKGFSLSVDEKKYSSESTERKSIVYRLKKDIKMIWCMECLSIGDSHAFYLEIEEHHGFKSFSTPLDSWKYFDERIEFKYQPSVGRHNALSLIYYF